MAEVATQDENPTRRKTLQERLTTLIESNMRNANLYHVQQIHCSGRSSLGSRLLTEVGQMFPILLLNQGGANMATSEMIFYNCQNVEKRLIQAPLATYQIRIKYDRLPYKMGHIILPTLYGQCII